MKMNTRRKAKTHVNFDGGKSYNFKDPFLRLKVVCASCFFGEPQYYKHEKKHSTTIDDWNHELKDCLSPIFTDEWQKLSPSETIEKAIDECLKIDPERTLEIARDLRNNDFMRTTPQVMLVRASVHPEVRGTGMIRHFADSICKRGDEPMVCFSYFKKKFPKEKIPMGLKKSLRDILESFSPYTIAKYKMEKNEVSMTDVIKYVHAFSPAIKQLFEGKAKQTDKTWNDVVSNSKASTPKEKKDTWTKALSKMPHMALLRNLRNLEKADVPASKWKEKFLAGVKEGKQFPFRYWAAFQNVSKDETKDIIEEALELSFDNVPSFKGSSLVLCDNSGSAKGTTTSEFGTVRISEIGNLMGTVIVKKSDRGDLVTFGDTAIKIPCRKKSSTFDILKDANEAKVGGSTETGLWIWLKKAIDEKIFYDRIFVLSDLQCGHGKLYAAGVKIDNKYIVDIARYGGYKYLNVPSIISEYRKNVNPNCMVYLIQTAGYTDTIMPEFFDKTFIIGGWSQGIINFAHEMENIFNQK